MGQAGLSTEHSTSTVSDNIARAGFVGLLQQAHQLAHLIAVVALMGQEHTGQGLGQSKGTQASSPLPSLSSPGERRTPLPAATFFSVASWSLLLK